MKPVKVFVYGTLKRGHRNNYILEAAQFLGTAHTVARCRLYHAGFPVLRAGSEDHKDQNAPVAGEVYLVTDEQTLARLDSLESEGHMYHRRTKLVRMANGKVHKAFAYVGDTRFWLERYPMRYATQDGVYVWPAEPIHTTY